MQYSDFLQVLDGDLKAVTFSSGKSDEESLAEYSSKLLEEANELPPMDLCSISMVSGPRRRRMKVDALGYDEIDRTYYGLVTEPAENLGIDTLTKTEIDSLVSQVEWFFETATNPSLRETIPNHEMVAQHAWDLSEKWHAVTKVKLIVVTTKKLSGRVRTYEAADIVNKPVEVQIWDATRLHEIFESRTGREEIEINFQDFGSQPLQMLEAPTQFPGAETYLTVLPGALLASIFNKFGSRLLEGNVRGFLSVRGDVNKGIRATILGRPERFLAFNNGITATATQIGKDQRGLLESIVDLQIVNGGQTTASLYNFLKQEKSPLGQLSKVSVAMKLIVVAPELADELVPDIAKYSNSQNKVSEADFFSNSPFHRRIEEISKRLVAPAVGGSQITTRWYYERARGSFENDRARASSTAANQRKFDSMYPKNQRIDKTELAKLHSIFSEHPHFARRGSQKNFKLFRDEVAPKFETDSGKAEFEDSYYRKVVATKILYESTAKAVRASDWFSQGYLADIVTYSISKLISDLKSAGLSLNWEQIWQRQAASPSILAALEKRAKLALFSITADSRKNNNVTEWAKTEECWKGVRDLPCEVDEAVKAETISLAQSQNQRAEARQRGQILDEVGILEYLNKIPLEYWETITTHQTVRLSPSNLQSIALVRAGNCYLLDKRKAKELLEAIGRAELEGIAKPV